MGPVLTPQLASLMLDAYERRMAGYPVRGTLLEEALELLYWGDISGWRPKR